LPDDDQIHAPNQVTITGPGLKVVAIGLTGHPKEQVFQLLKQVNTDIEQKQQSGASGNVS
jgi:lipopolysaccharide export system protein LptC